MNSLYGDFRNITFDNIWENANTFLNGDSESETLGWINCPFYDASLLTTAEITKIYYLLYANYGNSSIASNDVNRFQVKLFSLIYQYAPIWAKRTDLLNKLRNLTDDEIREGTRAIYNSAKNPGSVPSTSSLQELTFIDQQSTTGYKKGKAEAYSQLWDLISSDPTRDFISKFKPLFLTVVYPEEILLYEELDNDSIN